MVKKFLDLIKKTKYYFSKEKCYKDREQEGYAAMECCKGLAGGDRSTNYLHYSCVDCSYFVDCS